MRSSLAVFPIVLFFPFVPAFASFSDVHSRPDFAPGSQAGAYAPIVHQGVPASTFVNQCGDERFIEGRFLLPRRAYRATFQFSEGCDAYPETLQVEEAREAKFSVETMAGLRIYRIALRMVARDGREYARSFCSVDHQGRAQVPFGAVDWWDESGSYRFVPGRQPGETLEEGEQTTYVVQDADLGPDCWMVVCVRGRGVACRIPMH